METVVLDANEQENIKHCAAVIRNGDLVAFPTETVYGLGANALDESSVAKIFNIKGRPQDNPLIVHITSIDEVKPLVVDVPDVFELLAGRYWPGPLTLIMKKSDIIPDNVTAGLKTVAIRMPAHPAALALIRAFGSPIAAPSANPSGRPSPTKASHVLSDIGGKIPYILDGGDCEVGIESTVLDISGVVPKILRPGFVTYEELKNLLGYVESTEAIKTGNTGNAETREKTEVEIAIKIETAEAIKTESAETIKTVNAENAEMSVQTEETEAPKSPGMKYRHYAPKAPLTAVIGPPEQTTKYITSKLNKNVAALMFDDYAIDHPNILTFGQSDDYAAQASLLFDALRKADSLNVSAIYAQVPPEEGLGLAVANRIKKAAGSIYALLR